MIEKEIAELRRRLRPDKHNITHIRGCYVNERKEIISQFNESVGMLPVEDTEKYLALFRRVLTGSLGRNLLDITFRTQQVVDSDEHRLLMTLRDSELKDENAVQAFFSRTIQALDLEGNCLILLAYNTYDVFYKGKDDVIQEDSSSETFRYILCSICPVKETKPSLNYSSRESRFHIAAANQVVGTPELGFLFPAFDDRATNIYGALYYTRNIEESHGDFLDTLFHTKTPMPAMVQRETFQSMLGETLEEECSMELVQTVQSHLGQMIDNHKESKDPQPLTISKRGLKAVLSASGVSDAHVEAFEARFNVEFGEDAELSPQNLVDAKHLEVKAPDVLIQVNPERADLVRTRVVDGAKCIVIRVSEGVEVNGVPIHLSDENG